jgi:hypothetical protein
MRGLIDDDSDVAVELQTLSSVINKALDIVCLEFQIFMLFQIVV